MNEILFNLALMDAIQFCKDNNINPAGSHLVKAKRGYAYSLIRDTDDQTIVSTTFHKTSTPTHTFTPCSVCHKPTIPDMELCAKCLPL